jgi:hypothetical protein
VVTNRTPTETWAAIVKGILKEYPETRPVISRVSPVQRRELRDVELTGGHDASSRLLLRYDPALGISIVSLHLATALRAYSSQHKTVGVGAAFAWRASVDDQVLYLSHQTPEEAPAPTPAPIPPPQQEIDRLEVRRRLARQRLELSLGNADEQAALDVRIDLGLINRQYQTTQERQL